MSSSTGTKPGTYLICITGVNQACIVHISDTQAKAIQLPESFTWQDLKDFVRPETEHEIWTDMTSIPNSSGQKYDLVVAFPMQTDLTIEPEFLGRASVNGRRLAIVLWDISQSPPKQIAPNPAQAMSEAQAKWVSRVAHGSTSWSSVPPGQTAHQQGPLYTSPAALTQSMETLSLQQRQQQQAAYYAQHQQQQQQQQQQEQAQAARQAQQGQATYYTSQVQQPPRYDFPHRQNGTSRSPADYMNSQIGTPVNVRDGVAVTISRGIFVSGLNYKACEEDVEHKFSSVGDVVKCVLHKDTSTGKSKGFATILFKSATEAQKAVDKYNDATWMGKHIKVRVDRETTTVAAPPRLDASPLIVNGSRVQ